MYTELLCVYMTVFVYARLFCVCRTVLCAQDCFVFAGLFCVYKTVLCVQEGVQGAERLKRRKQHDKTGLVQLNTAQLQLLLNDMLNQIQGNSELQSVAALTLN